VALADYATRWGTASTAVSSPESSARQGALAAALSTSLRDLLRILALNVCGQPLYVRCSNCPRRLGLGLTVTHSSG
jgi:hypothetical protein